MGNTNNIRRRGKYSCHDFPRLGVSLLYDCKSHKYGIYETKKKIHRTLKKYKPSPEVKAIKITLACVLGIVLTTHLILLISKFV